MITKSIGQIYATQTKFGPMCVRSKCVRYFDSRFKEYRYGVAGVRDPVLPAPVIIKIEQTTVAPAPGINVPLCRSDSTTPVTHAKFQGMRLWSWELGDGEYVHSSPTYIGQLGATDNVELNIAISYHTNEAMQATLTLDCIPLFQNGVSVGTGAGKGPAGTSLTIAITSKGDPVEVVNQKATLIPGMYLFRLSCTKVIMIVSFTLQEKKGRTTAPGLNVVMPGTSGFSATGIVGSLLASSG